MSCREALRTGVSIDFHKNTSKTCFYAKYDVCYIKLHCFLHSKFDSVVIFAFGVKIKKNHTQSQFPKKHLSADDSHTRYASNIKLT